MSKKFAEKIVNSSLAVFTNKDINKKLKPFGWFFVSGFIFVFILTSLTFVSSTLPIQAYAESTPVVTSTVSSIHSVWDSFTSKIGYFFQSIFGAKDKVVAPIINNITNITNTTPPVVTPPTTIIQQITKAGLTGNTGSQGLRGFTGLQGPKGDKGEPGSSIDSSFFVSNSFLTSQVDRIYDSTSNSIQGLSTSLGKEINTKLLIVTGDMTVGGNLAVTGNITGNIIGNSNTVTSGVYTNIANSFSVINPLTTPSESWIGPSSTTGIYFKGGNVGIGLVSPGEKLSVNGNVMIGDETWAQGTTTGDLAVQGNVGIGTTVPLTLLNLQKNNFLGQTDNGITLTRVSTAGSAIFNYLETRTDSIDKLVFAVTGNGGSLGNPANLVYAKMVILANGNVGIGQNFPGSRLDVKGIDATSSNSALNVTDSGGVSKFFVRNDGNVGIGTMTPVSLTEIQGGLTTTGALLTLGTKDMSVTGNDILGQINFYAPLDTGLDSDLTAASIVAIAEGTFSDTSNSTSLQFRTGASEVATTKMTILSGGKVGIGTMAPTSALDIISNVAAGLNLFAIGTDSHGTTVRIQSAGTAAASYSASNTAVVNLGAGASGDLSYSIRAKGGAIFAESLGNVGIGTTVPREKLEVSGGNIHILNTAADLTNNALVGYVGATNRITAGTYDLARIEFRTKVDEYYKGEIAFLTSPAMYNVAPTEKMRISSAGNVGIGTTGPTSKLHLAAGSATDGTAPLGFTSGTLLTTAVAGKVEFLTDDYFATITTGAARKKISLLPTDASFALTAAKTFTVQNTLTLAGTDGSTLNIGTGGTLGTGAYSTIGDYLPLAGGTMTGGITNSTSVNPLTTLAKSWIGPSSTTGVYFKDGNVGIGMTDPTEKLTVFGGDISVAADFSSPESFAQTTFTPLHTKWSRVGDFSFIGDVPTYLATGNGYGELHQAIGDLATALVPGSSYRLEWTLQNVTAGVGCEIWSEDYVYYFGPISVVNGTSHINFVFSGVTSPYMYCYGVTGGFEVLSISLKKSLSGSGMVSADRVSAGVGLFNQIGIGTTNPSTGLDVHGSVSISEPTSPDMFTTISPAQILIYKPSTNRAGDPGLYIFSDYVQTGSFGWDDELVEGSVIQVASGAPGNKKISLKNPVSVGAGYATTMPPADGLIVQGNVGIGTTEPGANRLKIIGSDDLTTSFSLFSGGATTTGLVVRNDGNVGIGTTSPNERLDVNGTDPRIYLADAVAPGTTTNRLYSVSGDLTWNGVNLTGGGALPASTEGYTLRGNGSAWQATSSLFVKSDGNVGIGTTDPQKKLEINDGDANTTTSGLRFTNFACTGTDKLFVGAGGDLACATDLVGGGAGDAIDTLAQTLASANDANALDINNIGKLYTSLGTVSSPSYSFQADTDTGLWSSAANILNFSTDGSERMRIDASGNVGIGTTSPGSRLTINSGTMGTGPKHGLSLLTINSGDATFVGMDFNTDSSIGSAYKSSFRVQRDNSIVANSQSMIFMPGNGTTPTERMRIVGANGNVGIGTTNPTSKLYIDASGANTTPLIIKTNGSVGNYTPANSGIFIKDAAGTEILRIFASDPDSINNYNAANLYIGERAGFSQSTDNTSAGYYNTGIGSQALYSNTTGFLNTALGTFTLSLNSVGSRNIAIGSNALYYNTASENTTIGTNAMMNTSSGGNNVAVGLSAFRSNATGTYNTFIGHSAGFNGLQKVDAINSMALGYGTYTTADNQIVIGNTSITQTLLNGSVGIGNTSPSVALHVGSTSVVDSTNLLELQDINSVCTFNADTGAPSCGSDITLKKNINNQTDNLTKILALQPVTYNWLTDQEGAVVQHGFIAQAVAEVMPELVHDGIWTDGTTIKFLQTSGMIPYMVGAIKDLDLKLEDLTNTQIGMVDETGTETFVGRFFNRIKSWLADAGNGITKIFVGELNTDNINTGNLCVTDDSGEKVCITKQELLQIKTSAGIGATNSGSGSSEDTDNVKNTDVCPNIDEVQTEIPAGDEINVDGQCVEITGGDTGGTDDSKKTLDTIAPVITLTGESNITLKVGDNYNDTGATATDDVDASVTVDISGEVDTTTAGTYTITYNAKDIAGNPATEITRTVTIE